MIDWLTILLAFGIIASLVGIFAFMAWKINMPDPLISSNVPEKKDAGHQPKRKSKDKKKPKRENKDDEHMVKFKEPTTQTSEDTDNEQEESEQESTTPPVVESSSKVRNRNRKKTNSTTAPLSSRHLEGILMNKDEKSPVTAKAQPIPHPKLAIAVPKDEVELARQHHSQAKAQTKPTSVANKQTVLASSAPIPVKKSVSVSNNANQGPQKQQQLLFQEQQEQPFTTVGGNRHKAGTPPAHQQNKSINTTAAAPVPLAQSQQQQQQQAPSPSPPPPPPPPIPVRVQHEQLPQRQAPPRQQKETPTQLNGFNANSQPAKQPTVVNNPSSARLADIVKTLPSSQAVVTELMSALDASALSTDELDIIMHKIANKQSVIKQDWSKLQHGQKVDPQAHIGQVLDESARAYEEDIKTNAIKRINELTEELNNEKRRINDLISEKNDKDRNIQHLHAQLTTIQHPQQQMQSFQVELQRLSDENMQLKQRLTQQQQQFSSLNIASTNGGESSNAQIRVLSEQMKKLSVDNGNLEKQIKAKDASIKESQKEREDLVRSNQQLSQKIQETQKQYQLNEEKILKELNETRTLNLNQLNEYKRRIEQLEIEKTQLQRNEATATLNNEDRDKLERVSQENEQYKIKFNDIQNQFQTREKQLQQEAEQYKTKFNDLQNQFQTRENQLQQEAEQYKTKFNDLQKQFQKEIEQFKSQSEGDKNLNEKLIAANAELDGLRTELAEVKATNDSNNRQLEQEKYKEFLLQLLEQDARTQLPKHSQDFNQWLSSYRDIFTSNIEAHKRTLQDQSETIKRENDQLHQNMIDVEKQLREIEQTVQSKEERLVTELKSKDATIENIRQEKDQLTSEFHRLQTEIIRLQSTCDSIITENRALKVQLDERHLVDVQSPSTTADDSYEFVKQQTPSPAKIDPRAEELNQLIRSTKEALENQDSLVQLLDKHIDEMHHSGAGEISNVNDTTMSSSSNQP